MLTREQVRKAIHDATLECKSEIVDDAYWDAMADAVLAMIEAAEALAAQAQELAEARRHAAMLGEALTFYAEPKIHAGDPSVARRALAATGARPEGAGS